MRVHVLVRTEDPHSEAVKIEIETSQALENQIGALEKCFNLDQQDVYALALENGSSWKFLNEITMKNGAITRNGQELTYVNVSEMSSKCIDTMRSWCTQAIDDHMKLMDVATQAKRAVFQLEMDLKSPLFAEEFIAQSGLSTLLTVIEVFEGNTQAYALKALSRTLCYLNGLEFMTSSQSLMEGLLNLTYKRKSITAAREAVALIFVICEYLEDGYKVVDQAFHATSEHHGVQPYEQLSGLLSSGDLDAQINILTLLNVLMGKAEKQRERKRLVLQLVKVGILEVLEDQQNSIGHPEYVHQVTVFERLSGEVCTASHFQIESLRRQMQQLAQELNHSQQRIEEFQGEKQFVDIVRTELMRYRAAVRQAFEAGLLIQANAPMHRIAEEEAFKASIQPVLDLANQMSRAAESDKHLSESEKSIDELTQRLKAKEEELADCHAHAALATSLQTEIDALKANQSMSFHDE